MYSSLIPSIKEIELSDLNDQLRFGVICSQLYSEDEIFVAKFLDRIVTLMEESSESFKSIFDRLSEADLCLFLHVIGQHPNDKRNGSIDLPSLANDVLGCHAVGNMETFKKVSHRIILGLLSTRHKITAIYSLPEMNSSAAFIDVYLQEPNVLSGQLTTMALEPIYASLDVIGDKEIIETIFEFSKSVFIARIESQDDITILSLGVTYELKLEPMITL